VGKHERTKGGCVRRIKTFLNKKGDERRHSEGNVAKDGPGASGIKGRTCKGGWGGWRKGDGLKSLTIPRVIKRSCNPWLASWFKSFYRMKLQLGFRRFITMRDLLRN